jgi:hypothetical protein
MDAWPVCPSLHDGRNGSKDSMSSGTRWTQRHVTPYCRRQKQSQYVLRYTMDAATCHAVLRGGGNLFNFRTPAF